MVVGLAWNGCTVAAFRWSDAGGTGAFTILQPLGTPTDGGAPNNRATVISDDGTVIAGFAENGNLDRTPAYWTADGTSVLLDEYNLDAPGEVLSISGNGKTLAGVTGNDGFVWTVGTGLVRLPRFATSLPFEPVFPNAMTGDGDVVFGGVGSAFFSIPAAFAWTAEDGTRALIDIAAAHGINLPAGTTLDNVLAASADGTVLIGTATVDKQLKTFSLRLPAAAY